MGDKRRAPARDRAIVLLSRESGLDRTFTGRLVDTLLEDRDLLQELHDEQCLQDIDDMLHISSLVEREVDRLERVRERVFGRPMADVVREASEGKDGDPFAGFPKDGQP
jgi:hypothetical protein